MRKGIDCKGKEWEEVESSIIRVDLSGRTFGILTALFPVRCAGRIQWLCLCKCGNELVARREALLKEQTVSCGCIEYIKAKIADKDPRRGIDCKGIEYVETALTGKMHDLTGKVFGRLTALFPAARIDAPRGLTYWLCQCECGKLVLRRTRSLVEGNSDSCGCLHDERTAQTNKNKRLSKYLGRKFNKLTIEEIYDPDPNDSRKIVMCKCSCECGGEIITALQFVISGETSSCNCLKSLGEYLISKILKENYINFIHDKSYFEDLRSSSGGLLRYDFILFNDKNNPYRLIEFDGEQHIKPKSFFGGQEAFEILKKNDHLKNQYALSHNIPLVRIPYSKRDTMTLEDLLGDKYLITNLEPLAA